LYGLSIVLAYLDNLDYYLFMTNDTDRAARIQAAADACRDNAVDTVIERHGRITVSGWDFNTYLYETDTEKITQAGLFADEHGVTKNEVLAAMGLA
jgi:hypothetical protein